MKKSLKRIIIVVLAIVCSFSVHISVSAEEAGNRFPVNWEEISKWVSNLFGETTTAEPPNNQQEPDKPTPTEQTTDPTTVENPFNPSVTGSGTVTTAPTTYDYPTVSPSQNPNIFTTAETTTVPEEDSSLSFNASLSDLFEDDTAAVLVQTPTEPFTLNNGLVVKNDEPDDFTWQKAALIAAAVLFVVLAALVVALLVQRGKKGKENDRYVSSGGNSSDSSHAGPVPVEVMTPERIAELLGSASSASVSGTMTSEESAAAIKTAVLMGQLTHTYSDPLIRKYTDEPVMISPTGILDPENMSGAQILQATDSMLDDITGNEKYASDISGVNVRVDDLDNYLADGDSNPKICPECNKPVAADDIFCHSCGTYVG